MKYTEWTDELAKELAAPFPREVHKTLTTGKRGTHVPIHEYVKRLNELVGPQGWSMPEPKSYPTGAKLGMIVGVTILGVTKWNVGDEMDDHGEPDEDNKVRDFGSSSTNSFAQAFKRCMAYGFDCGGYLYDKEFTKRYLEGRTEKKAEPAGEHTMATSAELQELARIADEREMPRLEYDKLAVLIIKPMTAKKAKDFKTYLSSLPKREAATV